MSETHSSLLRRVRDPTDAESWREFVALYEPLLLAYLRTCGLHEHDARDVAQDVFAGLTQTMPGFELDQSRGRFRTWLWRVTRNAVADWARKQRRRANAEEEWRKQLADAQVSESSEPDAGWLTAYRKRVLEFLLSRVREETQPKTWACFEQYLLRGRPSREVAAELGITTNALYANASRLLARVRERCADYQETLSHG
jgi:RNA polymerase sigma-70 factor (ECF subfamily)